MFLEKRVQKVSGEKGAGKGENDFCSATFPSMERGMSMITDTVRILGSEGVGWRGSQIRVEEGGGWQGG